MTEKEILESALHKENDAYEFYDGLLKHEKVDFLRDLLEQLRDAEGQHRRLVEHRLTRLNLGHG